MEVEVEPRRLRNGKIVGEDEEVCEVATRMEDEQDDVGEEDGEGDVDEGADAASVDLEVDSNTSTTTSDAGGSDASVEEDVEEDVGEEDTEVDMDEDLQDATAKTLVRRRRDHLVKLCESRGIDVEGTKPQLVEALIQWVGLSYFHPYFVSDAAHHSAIISQTLPLRLEPLRVLHLRHGQRDVVASVMPMHRPQYSYVWIVYKLQTLIHLIRSVIRLHSYSRMTVFFLILRDSGWRTA